MGLFYVPLTTQGRLRLYLGYVGTAEMTAGSVGISAPNARAALTAGDVGNPISVIGAGPSPPFTPLYPTGYPGTLLVSKIITVNGDGSAVLADAAANNTQPGAANVVVYREVSTETGSIQSDGTLTTSTRTTMSATIFDPNGSLSVQAGQPVYMKDDVEGDYFGGQIDSVTARNVAGRTPGNNPVYWDINCISWGSLLERRLINPFFPAPGTTLPGPGGCIQPGTFVNAKVGDIVNQLVYNYCDSEGLSTNLGLGTGAVLAFFQANAGKESISNALDNLAKAAITPDATWIWWIDAWKKIWWVEAGSYAAPWHIDETINTDSTILVDVQINETREKLATRVYIDANQVVGYPITDYLKGEGSHSFSTSQPVGGQPTLTIASSTPIVVAISGSPPGSTLWEWSLGSNNISQPVLATLDGNINETATTLHVLTPLSVFNPPITIQIDNEFMTLTAGGLTHTWTVTRNIDIFGVYPAAIHLSGSAIYPAAIRANIPVSIHYPPLRKELFTAQNGNGIDTRASVESGTGFWDTNISLGYPFLDPTGDQGTKYAQGLVDEFCNTPAQLDVKTYRPGLNLGQVIEVNLLRPPVNEEFLIDKISLTTDNNRQLWKVHAVNGPLIGDWRKAFMISKSTYDAGGGGIVGNASPILSPIWLPGFETPMTGDAIYDITALGFGINQTYSTYAQDGSPIPNINIFGNPPSSPDATILIRVRREFSSGPFAQEAASISTNTISFGGSGLTVDQFKGRIISKLANFPGSEEDIPIQDFVVTGNNADGDFFVTPDPSAAGCQPLDLFTMRCARAAGTAVMADDLTADETSYTDPLLLNVYNGGGGGFLANEHKGRIALVIAGHGAGQPAQLITGNTSTKITISPGWTTIPDPTSVIVIVEATPQVSLPPHVTLALPSFLGSIPVPNYAGSPVRVEAYLQVPGGVEGMIEQVPFREIYIWGTGGTVLVKSGGDLP